MRIYFLNSQRLSELCFLSQLSALCFWTSTFHFSAFCLFGTDSSFPPKLYEGSLGGHSPHFQGRTRTFEKRVKLHYGNLMFPFCSHSLILRVTPQWCSSSMCLPTGFAFSGRIWFLSAFPLLSGGGFLSPRLDLDTKQVHVQLLLLLSPLSWVSRATRILHNLSYALLQLFTTLLQKCFPRIR